MKINHKNLIKMAKKDWKKFEPAVEGIEEALSNIGTKRERMRIITDKRVICKDEIYCHFFQCPECGDKQLQNVFKYCPKCGIKLGWRISEKYKDD